MENEKEKDDEKAIVAEYKVSMHCNACERTVAKAISKLKGVEKFMTDMNKHKVIIIGNFDPQKVSKKLRKKTGKKVEILIKEKQEETPKDTTNEISETYVNSLPLDCCFIENEALMMFSDENPNACSIM
ncbi:heavy metal-associated isoprenylated plant protein 19 [Durio zibethinus]|uniref:Heavy metal-associated isoprenylated plant protein 19 n=1 Tax=Durio zibethinus TaxID=66656 RepID=A0A6P6A8Q7_DURZI|nr:heavy metal-associated isoprenylated plant protein 19 [Durio zibethinus]